MAAHAIPVHRCAELIESPTGAKPSPGFVHSMLRRAAAAVAGANKLIRCLIILAHVVCADETPIRVGPGTEFRKRYLLVACTELLTYCFLGGPVAEDLRHVRPPRPSRHRHRSRPRPKARDQRSLDTPMLP
jgi:transposase